MGSGLAVRGQQPEGVEPAARSRLEDREERARRRSSRLGPLLVAAGAYLAVSLLLWWNIWSSHPTSTTTCACGDSALFLWFLEWPAYAIGHGHSLFYSTSLFHPQGINLLSNTSELAIGTLLAPVTWLFGPVATLNVASTLSPVLSALAMFWLLRRRVSWSPSAFVGGLLYGFSPFVIGSLADGHLMTGMLVVPPLVVGGLDEILIRQRRSPLVAGVGLGALMAFEFFVGTEMLVLMVVLMVVAVTMVVGYAAVGHRAELRRRYQHALAGLSWGAGTAVVLLAYPAWFALAGPAHLAGLVWPTTGQAIDGSTLSNLVTPTYTSAPFVHAMHLIGGYQGNGLVIEYFGIGLLAVVAVGLAAWRRDRRLWLFGALGAVSVVLSLGLSDGGWVPWALVAKLPVLENVIEERFIGLTYLCVAVLLGATIDRAHRGVVDGLASGSSGSDRSVGGSPRPGSRLVAAGVAGAIALVALVPIATTYAANVPLTVQHAFVPRWFTEVAHHLPGGQVVLAYPAPFSGIQAAMAWQAIDGMEFAMAGGSSPEGIADRAGKERPGFEVISAASLTLSPLPRATATTVASVRRALAGWGVTTVVVPNQPALPAYDHGGNVAYAVGLFTAALGQRPEYQADAWVWPHADAPGPQVAISPEAFTSCVAPAHLDAGSDMAVPDCVLASI